MAVRVGGLRHGDLLAPPTARGRIWVVGGVTLAVLVVLAVGVAIGRASSRATPAEGSSSDAAPPGPTRLVEGIPVGYDRSAVGAVAAAANYTVVLGGKDNMDPAYGDRVYPVFTLPVVTNELLQRSRDFAGTLDDPAARVGDPELVLRTAPMGYRLDAYSDDEATVTVWAVAAGAGTKVLPLATAWGTERLTLRWSEGDWRISAIERESGPTPVDGVPASADLAARMNGFEPFTYLAAPAP